MVCVFAFTPERVTGKRSVVKLSWVGLETLWWAGLPARLPQELLNPSRAATPLHVANLNAFL